MDCTEVRKRMFNEMLLFWGNHTHRDVESINDRLAWESDTFRTSGAEF